MSLGSLLSIARSALLAHQRAMEVTANNVANVNTPGYSRQRLDLEEATPLSGPFGTLGRGVSDTGVSRARDAFLDAAFRRDSALLGNSSTLTNTLGQVETAFQEPSDTGLGSALDHLFQTFGDLANDPPSIANRDLVVAAGQRLVNQFHTLSSQIQQIGQDTVDRLRADVGTVNSLAQKIAALNGQIQSAGGPMHQAADLQDQRDALVDQLSGLVGVTVVDRGNGAIAVQAGSTMLVDGTTAQSLQVKSAGTGFSVGITGSAGTIDLGSGEVSALVDLSTVRLPAVQAKLDQLANTLVTQMNAMHSAGFTLDGTTGVNFFDPAGTTAGTIGLSADVLASSRNVAAAGSAAPGDGSLAQQFSQLGSASLASLGGSSLRDFFTQIAAGVGTDVASTGQDADANTALVNGADQARSSVSGVSLEEEMTNLIGQQQAYSAAARLITIADQMMQDLLNTLGTA
jgi:flagellar hook-associated protein 1